MAIPVIDSFRLGARLPLDSRTVYASIAEALANIPASMRYKGLQVFITDLEKLYWFKAGVADSDFVEFDASSGNTIEYIEFKIIANGKDTFYIGDEILAKAKYHYATYNGILLYPDNDYEIENGSLKLLSGLTMDSTDEFRFYHCNN